MANNVFNGNTAINGAAIYYISLGIFSYNLVLKSLDPYADDVVFENNTFMNNKATNAGGAIRIFFNQSILTWGRRMLQ